MSVLRFLISAGPTREPIDPVRFLSNRSSGKMGYALAEAVLAEGHRVSLVSGPVHLAPPRKARFTRVETAAQMRTAVLKEAKRADVILMAAAVADYSPAKVASQKLKKTHRDRILKLKKTSDILLELGRRKKKNQVLVGFAAETSNLLRNAKSKLKSKNLDFIIANRVGGKNLGFESDDNRVLLLDAKGGMQKFPRMSKKLLAHCLLRVLFSKKALS